MIDLGLDGKVAVVTGQSRVVDRRRAVFDEQRAAGDDALGVTVATATSDHDAEVHLGGETFDVVISDIARGARADAGIAFIPRIRESDEGVPIIFYIREVVPERGTPAGAFGLTNRPDELIDLLIDALERRRA